jgi:hypothetical protein
MATKRTRRYRVVGWREWIALPRLGVDRIKVKIDTGARTSALHAFDLEQFERDGARWVRFRIHPSQRDETISIPVEVPIVDERWIRSSSGHAELRPVIETELQLEDERWPIEVSLTRRDVMGFRMLLGRQALKGRVFVHPGRSYLARKGLREVEVVRG